MAVVDASLFTALALPTDGHHQSAVSWYHRARRRRLELRAPTILIPEVAAAVARIAGDDNVTIDRALALVSAVVQLAPVSARLAQRAGTIARAQQIKGCDAIYVALAAEFGDELVSFDREQLERARPLVRAVEP